MGRQSFGYHDGGGEVHETNIFYDGFEFTVIERIRRDEAAGTVSSRLKSPALTRLPRATNIDIRYRDSSAIGDTKPASTATAESAFQSSYQKF